MEKESQGKIIVRCLPNHCGLFNYSVSMFNSKEEAIYQGLTSDEGVAEIPVPVYDEYEVMVIAPKRMCPKSISRWIKLNPKKTCNLYFIFSVDPFIPRNVTFHLTDQNYIGLPISEGEIYLWQDPM